MLYALIVIQGLAILFLTNKLLKAKRELSGLKFDNFMRQVDDELTSKSTPPVTEERILQ